MKKKPLSQFGITLLLLLLTTSFCFAQNEENVYNDVRIGDQHYVAIKYLKERHILPETNDNFHPNDDMTRVGALEILLRTLDKKVPKKNVKKIDFVDVKPSDSFYGLVEKAVQTKIIKGYKDKYFYPERAINKIEAIKLIEEQKNETPPIIDKPPFSDVSPRDWFAPYAQLAKEQYLVVESRKNGGELLGGTIITKAEFCEMIYRLLKNMNGAKFGRATYYSDILAGRGTASGDPYKPGVFTVAHKTLPFGTKLLVTNLTNGKSVEVKVNDRGPYATGVELDLSKSAFSAIASPSTGIIMVEYKILDDSSN